MIIVKTNIINNSRDNLSNSRDTHDVERLTFVSMNEIEIDDIAKNTNSDIPNNAVNRTLEFEKLSTLFQPIPEQYFGWW